ncbi:hypothetical protein DYE49_09390 [Treponema rectale]|uniref:Tetratricopeptide (TPR) repeat protein n=1 Tax=Treponema rectale TaxID=744512 RepID=A0A840SGI8_9SPIR|nr:hypothetical protein [Treponema rectale]MBB5220024.1 tetratricopeptide (TPR) repeat protein [Treponema rectale]QOS40660.1 hypothetical protein DYE49_09390 [Treponema rectale]
MKKICFIIAVVFFSCAAVSADEVSDIAEARALIEDSMTLCGVERDSSEFTAAIEDFELFTATLNETVTSDDSLSDEELAEIILTFVYDNVLRNYQLNQSFVDRAFSTGVYNCVSSSIIYAAFAKSAGLDVRAQVTKDHCFITLYTGTKKIDVETTNPYGFNPGVKKAVAKNANMTHYVTVPKRYYNGRKEVSTKMLASLPARNLMSSLTDRSMDEEAEELALRRMDYLSECSEAEKEEALNDYILCVRNHAVTLDRAGKPEQSLELLENLMDSYGVRRAISKDYDDFYYNAMARFYNNRDFEGGWAFIHRHDGGKYVSIEGFNKANDMMILGWNESFFDKILNSTEGKYAQMSQEERYLTAAKAAASAYKDNPSVRELKKYSDTFYRNYGVCVHNNFAELANAGKYEEARAVLELGLKNYPDSANLKRDLKSLNR